MRKRDRRDLQPPVFPAPTAVQAFVDQVIVPGDVCSERLAGATMDLAWRWQAGGPTQRELHLLAHHVLRVLAAGPDVVDVIKTRLKAKQLGFHDPYEVMPSLRGIDYRRLGEESRRLGRR